MEGIIVIIPITGTYMQRIGEDRAAIRGLDVVLRHLHTCLVIVALFVELCRIDEPYCQKAESFACQRKTYRRYGGCSLE